MIIYDNQNPSLDYQLLKDNVVKPEIYMLYLCKQLLDSNCFKEKAAYPIRENRIVH